MCKPDVVPIQAKNAKSLAGFSWLNARVRKLPPNPNTSNYARTHETTTTRTTTQHVGRGVQQTYDTHTTTPKERMMKSESLSDAPVDTYEVEAARSHCTTTCRVRISLKKPVPSCLPTQTHVVVVQSVIRRNRGSDVTDGGPIQIRKHTRPSYHTM